MHEIGEGVLARAGSVSPPFSLDVGRSPSLATPLSSVRGPSTFRDSSRETFSFQLSRLLPPLLSRVSPSRAPRTRSIDAGARGVLPIIAGKFGGFAQRQKGAMAQEAKHLQVTLESQVESVNLAEEMCLRVAEAAGFGEDDCYRIGMSVREGVINAFHYGNQERPEKKIHLAVDLTGDKMIIHVLDEGSGFRLSDVPDPLAEENLLSTSGRGIFLMRAFMDEFDVVRGWTDGAEIVMSKKLPSSGPESNGGGNSSHGAAPRKEA